MSHTISTILFHILVVVLATSCQKTPDNPRLPENLQHLYQSWRSSYEEKEGPTDSIQIYRPTEYKFPPSRFRDEYLFKEDGSCQWYVLSPDDEHYYVSGTWKASQNDNQEILIYDEQQKLQNSLSFRILDLRKDLLRIEPIE